MDPPPVNVAVWPDGIVRLRETDLALTLPNVAPPPAENEPVPAIPPPLKLKALVVVTFPAPVSVPKPIVRTPSIVEAPAIVRVELIVSDAPLVTVTVAACDAEPTTTAKEPLMQTSSVAVGRVSPDQFAGVSHAVPVPVGPPSNCFVPGHANVGRVEGGRSSIVATNPSPPPGTVFETPAPSRSADAVAPASQTRPLPSTATPVAASASEPPINPAWSSVVPSTSNVATNASVPPWKLVRCVSAKVGNPADARPATTRCPTRSTASASISSSPGPPRGVTASKRLPSAESTATSPSRPPFGSRARRDVARTSPSEDPATITRPWRSTATPLAVSSPVPPR